MSNRLNLDFSIETNQLRSDFVNEYLQRPEFRDKPPTESELNTIAEYILWGRDPNTGLNVVQSKEIQIATKSGTWDANNEAESLDALIESPLFNEAQLHSPTSESTRYIVPNVKFSREAALRDATPELYKVFKDLFARIDWLDLRINYYDLAHNRRTKPIRDALANRFTSEQHDAARVSISSWTPYYYLKQRKELVELRREQFTLRDSIHTTITMHTTPPMTNAPRLDWDAEIVVRPLGLMGPTTGDVFREVDELAPQYYSDEKIEEVVRYYWEKHDQKDSRFTMDFRDMECVYQLFLAFFDLEDAAADKDVESNLRGLLDTLEYYIRMADLSELHSELLKMKVEKVRNQDIAQYVNGKYGKNYTANYISTIFRQKIIPQINAAARAHEEIIGNLCFPEEFKTCGCCGRTYLRSADYFVRKSRSKDGLSSRCKKCDKQERMEKKVIEHV